MPEGINREKLAATVAGATGDVFQTMLGMVVEPGEPYVDKTGPGPSAGVVAVIGLAGQWVGTGSVSCSAELACSISSAMLMTDFEAVTDDVLDAVAEVTNMIIGNVKTAIEEDLGAMGLSIPTVIYGRNFSTRTLGHNDWLVIPFRTGGERFCVEICLAPRSEAPNPRPHVAVAGLT